MPSFFKGQSHYGWNRNCLMKCLQILFLLAILFQCLESLQKSAKSVLFKCEVVNRKTQETVPLTETFTLKLQTDSLFEFDVKLLLFLSSEKQEYYFEKWYHTLKQDKNCFIRVTGTAKGRIPCRFDLPRKYFVKPEQDSSSFLSNPFFQIGLILMANISMKVGQCVSTFFFLNFFYTFSMDCLRTKSLNLTNLSYLICSGLGFFHFLKSHIKHLI